MKRLEEVFTACYGTDSMPHTKLAIIGSGPAGYTAAIYAARADIPPVLFAGPEPGGQLALTTEVENFPGFPKGILGPELMEAMKAQAVRFGTTMVSAAVTKVELSEPPFHIWTDQAEYVADSVIIATGASAKFLGLPNEQRLRGHGVSACATCDGFFFRGKEVAVVGGGDTAMEEALFLTKFVTKVTILVRTDSLRASKIMVRQAESNPKIFWQKSVEVIDVLGQDIVSGVKIKNNRTEAITDVLVEGLFLAIGHKPNTEIFQDYLATVGPGYLKVSNQVFSSIPGVFIAGDVADYRYRQAVTAAGWGCMAALEVEKFLGRVSESKK